MKKIVLVLIAVAFVTAWCLAQAAVSQTLQSNLTAQDLVAEARNHIVEISVADARVMLENKEATFLDVREPDEYNLGHIPEAVNLPRGLLEFKINEMIPDKSAKIIVYCKSGMRSALADYTLFRMGYKNVLNLKGGWEAWNLEVQKPQIENAIWDLGKIKGHQRLKHNFILKNTTKRTLKIKDIRTTCGCTTSKMDKMLLLPGESTKLKVEFNSGNFSGPVEKMIYVYTDNPQDPPFLFKIKANVMNQ